MEQPDGELLAPGSFMEVAEDSDLIRPIGDWVLRRACDQLAEWAPGPDFHIAVNISGRELADLAVTGRVLECVKRSGIDPSQLLVELTESVLIDGGNSIVQELGRLKEAGVRLAIDDFGTGYCSLTYLERFPVDTVKIDRSFVAGLGVNHHHTAIVEAVVALSKSLDLTAIAEGIENSRQLAALRAMGCQWGQGFFLGRPMLAEELAVLLARPAAAAQAGHLRAGQALSRLQAGRSDVGLRPHS
jgi:EAL domain-containing protein (putative c-di-GMP-specific phosphodiesterase class I)